jgi:hypothetical protein
LAEATIQKVEPAANWVREKATAVLPESITHAKEDAKIDAERREAIDRMQGEAARDLGTTINDAPKEKISFREALKDVGTHVGESMSTLLEPVVQQYQRLTDSKPNPSHTLAPAPGSIAAAGTVDPAIASQDASSKIAEADTKEKEKAVQNL